ncbi:MAG: hypothetical protein HFJ93_04800 [Muribaculaceae bacterium]|jgi:hypothetical protein|nr:hypothetical protein [Muribaculaceae bacterium]
MATIGKRQVRPNTTSVRVRMVPVGRSNITVEFQAMMMANVGPRSGDKINEKKLAAFRITLTASDGVVAGVV